MVSTNSYSETESGTDSRSGNEEDGKTSDHSKGRNTGSLTSRQSDDNGEVFEEKTNCWFLLHGNTSIFSICMVWYDGTRANTIHIQAVLKT